MRVHTGEKPVTTCVKHLLIRIICSLTKPLTCENLRTSEAFQTVPLKMYFFLGQNRKGIVQKLILKSNSIFLLPIRLCCLAVNSAIKLLAKKIISRDI
jgi:hypothetical protein